MRLGAKHRVNLSQIVFVSSILNPDSCTKSTHFHLCQRAASLHSLLISLASRVPEVFPHMTFLRFTASIVILPGACRCLAAAELTARDLASPNMAVMFEVNR